MAECPDVGDTLHMIAAAFENVPVLVADHIDLFALETHRHQGAAVNHLDRLKLGRLQHHQLGLGGFAAVFPLLNRGGEAGVDFGAQKRLERVGVVLGVSGDNDFKRLGRTLEKPRHGEVGIGHLQLHQAGFQRRALIGRFDIHHAFAAAARRGLGHLHNVVRGAAESIAGLRGLRRFMAGAPAEHTAQPQHDKARGHREDDDVDKLKTFHRPGRLQRGQRYRGIERG